MILVIDNYDSFTYNIVQELGELGAEIEVRRNDQITLDEIREMNPTHIIISPGPGFPKDAGISNDVILEFGSEIPLMGICLGHQCIGEVYGGKVIHAPSLMHGKTSPVQHQGDSLFTDIPSPFIATRYHSLVVEEETLPDVLEVIALTADGEIMGVRHKDYPVIGVQFHPESILTESGMRILQNFLEKTYLKVKA
ncbi:MAG: aminodeoxychorismate/anthranilate synthase component II [Chloroflexota bacterium]